MCKIKCEIEDGLIPSEKVARITTVGGKREEVAVSDQLVDMRAGAIVASEVGRSKDGHVLVELPRESASGRWRIWVEGDLVLA